MDTSSFQLLFDWLAQNPHWIGWSIFLVSLLESLAIAGVLVPGVVLLFGACSLAGTGMLSMQTALLAAFAGAIMGDGMSFLLGKGFKSRIESLWPFRSHPEWLSNGQGFFIRYGATSIVLGRFVGPLRPVMPLVAGVMDMPSLRFILVNVLSAIGWAPLYVLPGFFFGRSTQWQNQLPEGSFKLIVAGLTLLLTAWVLLRLSHWQLQPEGRFYQWLKTRVDRSPVMAQVWNWLADVRHNRNEFPLSSLLLVLFSLTVLVFLLILQESSLAYGWNETAALYFEKLQHPVLNLVFTVSLYLGNSWILGGISLAALIWLYWRRHIAAGHHLLVALAILLSFSAGFETPAESILCAATVFFMLLSAFIGQEIRQGKRREFYSLMLLPILLLVLAMLYFQQLYLLNALTSFIIGLCLTAVTRLHFNRYNHRAIVPNLSLVLLLFAGLGGGLLINWQLGF